MLINNVLWSGTCFLTVVTLSVCKHWFWEEVLHEQIYRPQSVSVYSTLYICHTVCFTAQKDLWPLQGPPEHVRTARAHSERFIDKQRFIGQKLNRWFDVNGTFSEMFGFYWLLFQLMDLRKAHWRHLRSNGKLKLERLSFFLSDQVQCRLFINTQRHTWHAFPLQVPVTHTHAESSRCSQCIRSFQRRHDQDWSDGSTSAMTNWAASFEGHSLWTGCWDWSGSGSVLCSVSLG